MPRILNISSYKFIELENLPELRQRLLTEARAQELKGTILLATEGINLFLAGPEPQISAFMAWLRTDPRFSDLETKDSWSDTQPFQKMLVKLKKEIIRMNQPMIRPQAGRAPRIRAQQLRTWLDRGHDDLGRPLVLLDTRNAFEVGHGTFVDAKDLGLRCFSQFPERVAAHLDDWKDKTVVSFCTGGIRCEKAGLLLQEMGLEHSYQLDGGILRYFEEAGDAHFVGTCFVFDERIALNPSLEEQHPEGG